ARSRTAPAPAPGGRSSSEPAPQSRLRVPHRNSLCPAWRNCQDGPMSTSYDIPVVLDRREGPYGEVVLRRHGELLQIIANGCFLMDTSDGRSERLLVDAALAALGRRREPDVLIGGLGVGFSLAHAAADPRWGAI